MDVTVFGATGTQVAELLRSRGHAMTTFVRDPGKVPAGWGDEVAVVVCEVTDAAAIDRATCTAAQADDCRHVRAAPAISD